MLGVAKGRIIIRLSDKKSPVRGVFKSAISPSRNRRRSFCRVVLTRSSSAIGNKRVREASLMFELAYRVEV